MLKITCHLGSRYASSWDAIPPLPTCVHLRTVSKEHSRTYTCGRYFFLCEHVLAGLSLGRRCAKRVRSRSSGVNVELEVKRTLRHKVLPSFLEHTQVRNCGVGRPDRTKSFPLDTFLTLILGTHFL